MGDRRQGILLWNSEKGSMGSQADCATGNSSRPLTMLPSLLLSFPPLPLTPPLLFSSYLAPFLQQESPFSKFVDGLSPIGPSRAVGASLGQVMPSASQEDSVEEDAAAAAAVAAATSSFADLSPSRCTLRSPGLHFRSPMHSRVRPQRHRR